MGLASVLCSRNFLILISLLVVAAMWQISMPSPAIHSIMYKTHQSISNLKSINMISSSMTSQHNDVDLDQSYLEMLGFTKKPKLYRELDADSHGQVPVIVTEVSNANFEQAISLLESVQKHMEDKEVVMFDIGLGSYELVSLQKRCNETSHCAVKPFEFDKFPAHIRNRNIKAYRPILIQQALNEYRAVLWTTAEEVFVSGDINAALAIAKRVGVVAWPALNPDPTSALTHPKMFKYFGTDASNYFFQRMVGTEHLLIYNTAFIHAKVMLLWVQCALRTECVWPLGAQRAGCREIRKPRYVYSGCHHCDASALSVVLGLLFNFGEGGYPYMTEVQVFGPHDPAEAEAESGLMAGAGRRDNGSHKISPMQIY